MKLKGDIFKEHSDKLGLLWTTDQWNTVMGAMQEYAEQENKELREEILKICKEDIRSSLKIILIEQALNKKI